MPANLGPGIIGIQIARSNKFLCYNNNMGKQKHDHKLIVRRFAELLIDENYTSGKATMELSKATLIHYNTIRYIVEKWIREQAKLVLTG